MLRGALALLLGALAALVLVAVARDAWADFESARGERAYASAQRMLRSVNRDRALDDAQAALAQSLQITPADGRLWGLLSEVRLMQATEASVNEVSPALLEAAAEASARAIALAPRDVDSHVRLALVRAMLPGQQQAAAEALARSFAPDQPEPLSPARRLEAAARAWDQLPEPLKSRVLTEACAMARTGEAPRMEIQAVRMGPAKAEIALALDGLLNDPACAARG